MQRGEGEKNTSNSNITLKGRIPKVIYIICVGGILVALHTSGSCM